MKNKKKQTPSSSPQAVPSRAELLNLSVFGRSQQVRSFARALKRELYPESQIKDRHQALREAAEWNAAHRDQLGGPAQEAIDRLVENLPEEWAKDNEELIPEMSTSPVAKSMVPVPKSAPEVNPYLAQLDLPINKSLVVTTPEELRAKQPPPVLDLGQLPPM
jgi:hypothetical protein